MSESVSLIDGHIDWQHTCKDCTQRHYNCHSECDQYKRWAEDVKKKHKALSEKRILENAERRHAYSSNMRRGRWRR